MKHETRPLGKANCRMTAEALDFFGPGDRRLGAGQNLGAHFTAVHFHLPNFIAYERGCQDFSEKIPFSRC